MLTLLASQPDCLWDDALPVEVKALGALSRRASFSRPFLPGFRSSGAALHVADPSFLAGSRVDIISGETPPQAATTVWPIPARSRLSRPEGDRHLAQVGRVDRLLHASCE